MLPPAEAPGARGDHVDGPDVIMAMMDAVRGGEAGFHLLVPVADHGHRAHAGARPF
ncbi:hypothetical protein ACGF5C_25925 [Micromonospora sp. NPDC047620]|uniref:hypothetical protein n=1 Tax=Micromonospora sp. NPDC047620 TaxID=3364251 RepID=UPI003713DD5C